MKMKWMRSMDYLQHGQDTCKNAPNKIIVKFVKLHLELGLCLVSELKIIFASNVVLRFAKFVAAIKNIYLKIQKKSIAFVMDAIQNSII